MTNLEDRYKAVSSQLGNLRVMFVDPQSAQGYLDLFNEFVSHNELGLALETLCDFLLEAAIAVDDAVISQIETLHNQMKVKDDCVQKLRGRAART